MKWIQPVADLGIDDVKNNPKDDSGTPPSGTIEDTGKSHGTSMLSIVAGNILGVAKRLQPILVRLPRRRPTGGGFTPEDWLKGLESISSDLGPRESTELKGILLLAQDWIAEAFRRRDPQRPSEIVTDARGNFIIDFEGFTTQARALLVQLQSKGVLIVSGAGNGRSATPIIGWPQVFAFDKQDPPLDSLLLVGAISTDGKEVKYSMSPDKGLPQVFAPGIDILTAQGKPIELAKGLQTHKYTSGSGTSICKSIQNECYCVPS